MKKALLALGMAMLASTAFAQDVSVGRTPLGSGQQGVTGLENAQKWDNDIYHAPQYLPGFPTAATLWPRVVDVQCTRRGARLECAGYNWVPEMGRGEYLMLRPVVKEDTKPVVITNTVIREVAVPILVEVPAKKGE